MTRRLRTVILREAKDPFYLVARVIVIVAWTLCIALPAAAQQPDVVHAKLQTRPVAGGIEKEFGAVLASEAGPAWIGYAVPLVAGNHHMCCNGCENRDGENFAQSCRLEGEKSYNLQSGQPERVELEGPRLMWVLFRVAHPRVEKIRAFSSDCRLDAGGLPFYWLTGVRATESIEFLSGIVRAASARSDDGDEGGRGSNSSGRFSNFEFRFSVRDGALAAIALTDDPAADRALDRFVAVDSPATLRGHATFWLGAARSQHGLDLLKRIVQEDPSEHVRKQAVFGLSISKQPGALQALIDVVHHGSSGARGQALFWLAQKASKKAAETITDAIENDPETEVKKRAVFALTQMPADEGVPLLINVARTNHNPEVRKQAIFWLGQSHDPRAWTFIEDVLSH